MSDKGCQNRYKKTRKEEEIVEFTIFCGTFAHLYSALVFLNLACGDCGKIRPVKQKTRIKMVM